MTQNILILHNLGNPKYVRESVRSLEYMLPEEAPEHNYIIHDANIQFPEVLKNINYNLIILGPTFLCARYSNKKLNKFKKNYNFIKDLNSCKIALPQDDYDCSDILDEWLYDLKVDIIYTVCPNNWEVLYKKNYKKNNIRLGYTGYLSTDFINKYKNNKNRSERLIDVSYRAKKLPANFGRLGQLKSEFAERFLCLMKNKKDIVFDISTESKKTILGTKWYDFILSSKCCLITPSGSSLVDPKNKIRKCIQKETKKNKNINYFELEKRCFPNLDGVYKFTAISPRNIESAILETVQIGIVDEYSGIMTADQDYISFEMKENNVEDLYKKIKNINYLDYIAKNCKEKFLSIDRLRRDIFVKEILNNSIEHFNSNKYKMVSYNVFENFIRSYKSKTKIYYDLFYKIEDIKRLLK